MYNDWKQILWFDQQFNIFWITKWVSEHWELFLVTCKCIFNTINSIGFFVLKQLKYTTITIECVTQKWLSVRLWCNRVDSNFIWSHCTKQKYIYSLLTCTCSQRYYRYAVRIGGLILWVLIHVLQQDGLNESA